MDCYFGEPLLTCIFSTSRIVIQFQLTISEQRKRRVGERRMVPEWRMARGFVVLLRPRTSTERLGCYGNWWGEYWWEKLGILKSFPERGSASFFMLRGVLSMRLSAMSRPSIKYYNPFVRGQLNKYVAISKENNWTVAGHSHLKSHPL